MLTVSMQGWRTELTCCNESLGQVKVRRGIFQGDSFSPLLFVTAVIPLNLVLRKMNKYLGILQPDQVPCNEMKENVGAEYKRRAKKC